MDFTMFEVMSFDLLVEYRHLKSTGLQILQS